MFDLALPCLDLCVRMFSVIDEDQTGRVNTHQSQSTFQVYFGVSSQSGGPDIIDCLNQTEMSLE